MRDKIKLESTAGTGHFYTTTKNKKTMPGKMERRQKTRRRCQARWRSENTIPRHASTSSTKR